MSTTQSEPLAERCYDLNLRVDRITHLDTMATGEACGEVIEYLVENCTEILASQFGVDGSEEAPLDVDILESECGWVFRNGGWIVEASTPVVGESGSYSWGYYRSRPFFGQSYDDALNAAIAWAQSGRVDV